MVIPNTYESEKWVNKTEDFKSMVSYAKNTVENIKGNMRGEMSKMNKIGVKYASMKEILDELSSKERDFEKFIRVIMR